MTRSYRTSTAISDITSSSKLIPKCSYIKKITLSDEELKSKDEEHRKFIRDKTKNLSVYYTFKWNELSKAEQNYFRDEFMVTDAEINLGWYFYFGGNFTMRARSMRILESKYENAIWANLFIYDAW